MQEQEMYMRIHGQGVVWQFKNKERYANTCMISVRLNKFSVTGTNKLALINLVKYLSFKDSNAHSI